MITENDINCEDPKRSLSNWNELLDGKEKDTNLTGKMSRLGEQRQREINFTINENGIHTHSRSQQYYRSETKWFKLIENVLWPAARPRPFNVLTYCVATGAACNEREEEEVLQINYYTQNYYILFLLRLLVLHGLMICSFHEKSTKWTRDAVRHREWEKERRITSIFNLVVGLIRKRSSICVLRCVAGRTKVVKK